MKTSNHKYSLLLIAVICLFPAGCKTDRKKNNVSFEKNSSSIYEIITKGRDVLISLGGDGAILLTEKNEVYYSNTPKGQVINTVGAGDSMVAGFVAGT